MNVYDTVNKLAQEIRNSDEYINYKKIKEEVNADLELKKKIENFQKMRYEVQLESLRTGDQENPKIKEMQELLFLHLFTIIVLIRTSLK